MRLNHTPFFGLVPSKLTSTGTSPSTVKVIFLIAASLALSFNAMAIVPVLAIPEATDATFTRNGSGTVVSPALTAVDPDSNISGATVWISGNLVSAEDVLLYTLSGGVTASYDNTTGTLTLSGSATPTIYRTILRSIRYRNTNTANPTQLTRTISMQATDGAVGNVVSRNVVVINDRPVVSNLETSPIVFTEDGAPLEISGTLELADANSVNLASATIVFSTTGYSAAQDRLVFTDFGGITGTWNSTTRTMSLTGSAPVATYQAAIRSVAYQNTNTYNPSTATRTINITVSDGGVSNTPVATRTIQITTNNDAPVISNIQTAHLDYYEGQTATSVTNAIMLLDDGTIAGATIQITGNYLGSEDILSFTNTANITGTWNAASGTMTLSGVDTYANYQAALRVVRYRNSNTVNPSSLTRTVTFIANDGTLSSNSGTREIAVLVTDKVTTQEEVAIDIDVLSNDHDLYAAIDPTTVTLVAFPANGTAVVNPTTGIITYTPNDQFSGSNTFRYTVRDINGAVSLPKNVVVTVSLINDAPSFTPGPDILVNEDAGTQSFPGWATNMNDNDPFTTQSLTFVVSNDRTSMFAAQPSINAAGTLTFRTNTNSNGTATVTVYLRDSGPAGPPPNVNVSPSITFTIKVKTVNDPPVGNPETFSTSSDSPLTANAKTNDTDPEGDATFLSPTPLVAPAHGSVVIHADGTFIYTPNTGYTGPDSFTYQVCDNGTDDGVPASRCGQATVSITVNPVNTEWNIVGNNSIQMAPDHFVLTPELNNQQGAIWNRKPLDLRYSFELNLKALFSAEGVVKDDGADGIVFVFQRDLTPPPLNVPDLPIYARGAVGGSLGIGGISPSFSVEVDTYQNAAEPAEDHISIDRDGDVYNYVATPRPALLDGLGNPVNIEDGQWHDIKIVWDNPNSTIRVFFDGQLRVTNSQDIATLVFGNDPRGVYWGFSSATGGKNNYQAVKDIAMTVTNLPPSLGTYTAVVDEDQVLVGQFGASDADPEGTPLHIQAETKNTAHGKVVINADGTYTYTPNHDYFGNDSFTYQVCDEYVPAACATGTVSITINNVQDAPVAVADEFTTLEDTQLIVTCNCVLINDYDADGDPLTAVKETDPAHGTIVFNPNGEFTYQPDPDWFGTDTFTYHANDGKDNSNTVVVTIHVTPVNDAPVALDDNVTIDEDVAALLPILANDKDVDDALTTAMITVITAPTHGVITISTTGVLYTPVLNYYGTDVFTYTLTDPAGATSAVAQVNITINSVNDVPVTGNDVATTAEDTPVTIDVLANDTDVDDAIIPSSVKVVTGPAHGTTHVNADGTIIYTPAQDYFGSDSFDYTVKDASTGTSFPATVSITVTPVNDAPVAFDDAVTTLENTAVDISVVANDIDVDDPVSGSSVVILTMPVHGIIVNNQGVITYTPHQDYLGVDEFTYTIADPAGLVSQPAKILISVVPPNRPPVAVNDGPIQHRFLLDLTIDVLANDFDVDNDHSELTLVSFTQPAVGMVEMMNGMLVYHPAGTDNVQVTFSYTISDPAGLTSTAIVTIDYIYNPLTVSEGFSPNLDGNNDTWYILSIENFPDNTVKIFDRWGLMVYQKAHYENDISPWDGRANIGQQAGKLLDQGTYYYMLDVGGEIKMLSGFVMIVR